MFTVYDLVYTMGRRLEGLKLHLNILRDVADDVGLGSHSAVHSSDIFIKLISSPGPPGSNELLTNRIIEINERLHCGWILTALMR